MLQFHTDVLQTCHIDLGSIPPQCRRKFEEGRGGFPLTAVISVSRAAPDSWRMEIAFAGYPGMMLDLDLSQGPSIQICRRRDISAPYGSLLCHA